MTQNREPVTARKSQTSFPCHPVLFFEENWLLCTQELPGLRGFSESNMRKMRIFYEERESVFKNRSLATNEIVTTLA